MHAMTGCDTTSRYEYCKVRAIRYKRIFFFYELPRRVSFRSLRLRLRHCLLWCRELSMLPRTLVLTCFLDPWCRARGQMVSTSPVVPRTRMLPLIHGAAQFYVLPRPMLPRSSLCCRVPCCRAVFCVAAFHAAAQFSV